MNVNGKHFRTIWLGKDGRTVRIIDQRQLPHRFAIETLRTVSDVAIAIKDMHVRGAGLIGAAAGYGMYLASLKAPDRGFDSFMQRMGRMLRGTRPTAANLGNAVERQLRAISSCAAVNEKRRISLTTANEIADEDAEFCRRIGVHGARIIERISMRKKGRAVNVLTHCNAGWLAFVDYGSALAPVYEAFNMGIKVHVWVDETRPRNQGASLTAWELGMHGVPHTVIADNTGGHLMQHGMVDMVITGADRVTRNGDAANKIGTYLKAVAARDNGIPFYVAFPSSTFDFGINDGIREIPIEERNQDEVRYISGLDKGRVVSVLLTPKGSKAKNFAFDVTPARLITGLITERGVCRASKADIQRLFPR